VSRPLSRRRLLAYSALAAPLAMLTLPVYIHVPKFYAEHHGLALGTQGVLLLGARALDALVDPLLGLAADRARARGVERRWFVLLGAPLLALAACGLFAPPAVGGGWIGAWFFLMLVAVYIALALVQISYHAQGAELSLDPAERTRVTAMRESFALLGVLAGALLPQVFDAARGSPAGHASFGVAAAGAIVLGAVTCAAFAPTPAAPPPRAQSDGGPWETILRPLRAVDSRRLFALYLLNGTANAIPATVVLFYIDDVIGRGDLAGAFLCTYFLAGVVAMPLWPWLTRRLDKTRAWLAGMLGAVAAFAWALTLGPGDVAAYFAVCALSGLALGADLALPPALLADAIDRETAAGHGYPAGAWFGLWTLTTKLALALAAGIALPLLAWAGYEANGPAAGHAPTALPLVYALLPCALKAAAATMLWCNLTPRAGSWR